VKKWKTKTVIIAFLISLSVASVGAAVYNMSAETKIVDNGYYPSGEFGRLDKKKSPIVNMTILLKLLNTANFCDEDWFEQVRNLMFVMGAQVDKHIEDDDEFVHELMVKQKRIVVALKAIEGKYPASQAKLEDVDELEEAYNDYHDYYYTHYGKGGDSHE
jgi:hypothetical protein